MKISAQHRYDCSIDELFALFTEQKFYEDKFEHCGARNIKINRAEQTDEGFVVDSQREVPADVPVWRTWCEGFTGSEPLQSR